MTIEGIKLVERQKMKVFSRCWFIIAFILLTCLVEPWRHSVSQDDATYAAQAISFSKGVFRLSSDAMAFTLPQTFFGAVALKVIPFFSPLSILNSISWCVFFAFLAIMIFGLGIHPILGLSIFTFPFWIQYGASFLYDSYVALFLVILISGFYKSSTDRVLGALILCLSSFLISIQLQSWMVLPFCLSIACGVLRRPKSAVGLFLGGATGFAVYVLWPHSLMQQSSAYYLLRSGRSVADSVTCTFQLMIGLGLFWIPLMHRHWNIRKIWKTIAIQSVVFAVLWMSSSPILAAGVFFSDYLPRALAILLVSLGIWGWSGTSDLWPKKITWQEIPFLITAAVILIAYGLRGVNDIRYTMLLVPMSLWIFHEKLSHKPRIGNNFGFLGLMATLSIFLNRYNLDTVQARWDLARELESSGVMPSLISAGYGRDHFRLEEKCVLAAYEKLGNPSVESYHFFEHIYRHIPRVYKAGWVPRFVIKPYRIFNKTLLLKSNLTPGQTQLPVRIYPYTSLGVSHALAVYENTSFQSAWCFSP